MFFVAFVLKLNTNNRNKVITRGVIRSPDIRTFESRSEVRTQFQYPEVRIKYYNFSKMYNFI